MWLIISYNTYMSKRKKLVIFDGHALVHRGFHAIPYLTTKDGTPTNAVYGFTMMMLLALKELKPDYCIVAWDAPGKTFRHDKFADYKGTRKKAPDELYAQLPITKDVVAAFNIPLIEESGYEADDIIGSLARKHEKSCDVVIVTGDMDELQLVTDKTRVYTMRKGFTDTVIYGPQQVQEKYGVNPQEFIVYKALKGDASDNIPGVAGIGDKGATDLVSTYKTLDNIYKNLDELKPALKGKLEAGRESAYLSEDLSTIECNMKLDFDLKKAVLHDYDHKLVYDLFHKLEFKSLLTKLPKSEQAETDQEALFEESVERAATFNREHLEKAKYVAVTTDKDLQKLVQELKKQPVISIDTETTSTDVMMAELVGISLSWAEGEAYYVPVGHDTGKQLPKNIVLKALKPILEDPKIGKIGHNIKYDYEMFVQAGVRLGPVVFDTMVAAFLINPIGRAQSLSELAYGELGISMIDIVELIGKKGKDQQTFNAISIDQAAQYAAEDADIAWRLYKKLSKQLQTEPTGTKKMTGMAEMLEWPLIEVLGDMELTGVGLDTVFLAKLSKQFATKITSLRNSIHTHAGKEFNVSSPAQLQTILFEELNIDATGLKKTKTGISTAASELEKLRGRHPVVEELFEYRELTKLQSTYIDALPQLVAKDGKIHTSYNQTIAQTGRLSSTNPNLQNIPVRTEVGRQIRKAFVAGKGRVFVSADYSQIELRLAAALAGDKPMIKAFVEGADIHTQTAAEMFDIQPAEVKPEQRYAAKAINFGVLYGMNTHGLSVATGFDYAQAKEFIDRYFETRKAVAEYIKSVKQMAHDVGYTETIFGRRRPCPDVKSSNYIIRSAAERAAVNMPLQGTAADMMKLAMVRIYRVLPKDANLILQIHDELIVECNEAQAKAVAKIMETEMVGVHKFAVPIEVGIKIGKSWGDLE
jgi:DNA polymerase-1